MADSVLLAHGSGGRLTHELIDRVFRPALGNAILDIGDDSAVFDTPAPGRLALTTDTYVVKPLFFPGGDIGRLAVCGTVNDLSVMGASPLYLSAGFVLEEGLDLGLLGLIVASMGEAAAEAEVRVVTGDTKVVERGRADGVYINTAGIGLVPLGLLVGGGRARPGDVVLLSGAVGDHGIAVVSQREGLRFQTTVRSDAAPLNRMASALVTAALEAGRPECLRSMRDPTRGGLATTLNELARQSGTAIAIDESAVPVHPGVRAACEMLGYDPLYVANEGKLVAVVAAEWADAALAAIRSSPYGTEACRIGRVLAGPPGRVMLRTGIGGTRILDMLSGELLPRIC